jgi:hypothetical protein
MPSKMHQMLIGLIARRMTEKGYEIVAFDGKEYLFDGKILETPPKIKRHRPDILGYRFSSKEICVGEAKTKNDLSSKRTEEQLIDYSSIVTKTSGNPVEIIIGIPRSVEMDLVKLLRKLDLYNKEHISYIWLPEELVGDD